MKNMDNKRNNNSIINAKTICLISGILNAICFLYCIIEWLLYNDPNIFLIISTALMSLYFLWFSLKK